ncbi:uncharacterized protein TM35_000202030 [Trypanosoma theileri]|uniref:Kinesin n=1 Tax=Trypanosoma theileri TaxID=67003 RepID=A0A1X0NSW6_9TRYP|nr:uncharacterized protein TM35_000202030 [Trypanosoma theileri]ORC87794.1 hypothetical protein TM35_000202030 [Trypanosoma theileri]
MRPTRGVCDGRVTVAVNITAGRCTAAENNGQHSNIRLLHSEAAHQRVSGVTMEMSTTSWTQDAPIATPTELTVRTPLITVEGGEKGTLPYVMYTQTLAAHISTTLMQTEGVELMTVVHGAAGSGKSIQLFGAAVGNGVEEGQCSSTEGRDGLFTAVIQRIFNSTDTTAKSNPCVAAISVVEWRSFFNHDKEQQQQQQPSQREEDYNRSKDKTLENNSELDKDVTLSMEALDLLARVTDQSSPTGCFMEDYADIPAARYIRCESLSETLAVLHAALRHSLSWQSARTAFAQGSTDVFEVPDTRSNAERRRRVVEAKREEEEEEEEESQQQQREEEAYGYQRGRRGSSKSVNDFLRPTAGAGSHILITLLLRHSSGSTSIWRLWDLSGPSVWMDDESPASCMAFNTHTAISQMAYRYMHRDQLQGGWWLASTPPEHIEEIVPLFFNQQQQQEEQEEQQEGISGFGVRSVGIDKVTAMIEATLQHTCSSVLWITALRLDACYDDINEDVLGAAASLLSGSDGTNAHLIAELRRRRREENLCAASRVIDMFAIPFSRQRGLLSPPLRYHENSTLSVSTVASVNDVGGDNDDNDGVGLLANTSTTISRTPRLMSPVKTTPPDVELLTLSEISRTTSLISAVNTHISNHRDAPLFSTSPLSYPPWSAFMERQSCLEVQSPYTPSQDQHQHPQKQEPEEKEEKEKEEKEHLPQLRISEYAPPPPFSLLHLTPLNSGREVGNKSIDGEGGASPLSPPSVSGTEYPEESVHTDNTMIINHNLNHNPNNSTSTSTRDDLQHNAVDAAIGVKWSHTSENATNMDVIRTLSSSSSLFVSNTACEDHMDEISNDRIKVNVKINEGRRGEKKFIDQNEGLVPVSSSECSDLASTVRSFLQQPLAELQELTQRSQAEARKEHRRDIARLNTMLYSDAIILAELQKSVKEQEQQAEEEKQRVSDEMRVRESRLQSGILGNRTEGEEFKGVSGKLFGPSTSLQTSLEREVMMTCSGNCSGRGDIHTRPCGCARRKVNTTDRPVSPTRQLIAAERKIRFLEQQVLRLELENSELRAEMSSRCMRYNGEGATTTTTTTTATTATSTTLKGLESVFNDILQRCSQFCSEKSEEAKRARQKCDEAIAALQHLQQQHQHQQEGEEQQMREGAKLEKVSRGGVLTDNRNTGLFADTTNQQHVNGENHNHLCQTVGTTTSTTTTAAVAVAPTDSFTSFSSSAPKVYSENAIAEHLRRVLLRATVFAPTSGDNPPQEQQEQQRGCEDSRINGLVLSIDRGSEVSVPVTEVNGNTYNGLRAFREATERVRDIALRTLSLAKKIVQENQQQQPSSFANLSTCDGDLELNISSISGGVVLNRCAADLVREETNVYRAVASLQREAAELQHVLLESMTHERQLLNRVLLA